MLEQDFVTGAKRGCTTIHVQSCTAAQQFGAGCSMHNAGSHEFMHDVPAQTTSWSCSAAHFHPVSRLHLQYSHS